MKKFNENIINFDKILEEKHFYIVRIYDKITVLKIIYLEFLLCYIY